MELKSPVKIDVGNDFFDHPINIFQLSSVLTRAIKSESPRNVKFLLEKGCDPNSAVGNDRIRPLMVACYLKNNNKRMSIFQHLLSHGADPSLSDLCGRNGYMYACGLSLEKELLLLIKYSETDLNVTDVHGDTLLHICAKTGNANMLRIVLKEMKKYRLNISIQNKSYFTPLSLAIFNGHHDCAKELHEAGGSPRFQRSLNSSGLSSQITAAIVSSAKKRSMELLPPRPATAWTMVRHPHSGHSSTQTKPLKSRHEVCGSAKTEGSRKLCEGLKEDDILDRFESQITPSSGQYINMLLNSSTCKKRISSSYSNPSRDPVKVDSNWLATINKYRELIPQPVDVQNGTKGALSSSSIPSPSSKRRSPKPVGRANTTFFTTKRQYFRTESCITEDSYCPVNHYDT